MQIPLFSTTLTPSLTHRFEGKFTEADGFSSYCGNYTDATGPALIDGAFDFKVDFPPNIQGDKKVVQVAIEDSRKGAAPKKWFPGSTMVSPGKYVETTNEQQHKGWGNPGTFSYSPKVVCKQGKKTITYDAWTQNKKEQARRDRMHKRMVDAAIEETAKRSPPTEVGNPNQAPGSSSLSPSAPHDDHPAPADEGMQGEDGTQTLVDSNAPSKKQLREGDGGGREESLAEIYGKQAAEVGLALSPPKKVRAFFKTYTPPPWDTP